MRSKKLWPLGMLLVSLNLGFFHNPKWWLICFLPTWGFVANCFSWELYSFTFQIELASVERLAPSWWAAVGTVGCGCKTGLRDLTEVRPTKAPSSFANPFKMASPCLTWVWALVSRVILLCSKSSVILLLRLRLQSHAHIAHGKHIDLAYSNTRKTQITFSWYYFLKTLIFRISYLYIIWSYLSLIFPLYNFLSP